MNLVIVSATILGLCVVGCGGPPPALPIRTFTITQYTEFGQSTVSKVKGVGMSHDGNCISIHATDDKTLFGLRTIARYCGNVSVIEEGE